MTRAVKKARVGGDDKGAAAAPAVKRARVGADDDNEGKDEAAPPPRPSVALGVLLPALVIRRPSVTVRTPYVADVVALPEGASAAAAAAAANAAAAAANLTAHTPAMDCAGLITPGRRVHVAPLPASSAARRCTHSVVLAHDTRPDLGGDALICAHPASAERLAAAALRAGAIEELGAARAVLSQQTVSSVGGGGGHGGGGGAAPSNPPSSSSSTRTDFVLERADGSVALVEVKIVVCADYPSPGGRSGPLVPEVAAAAAPKKSPAKNKGAGVLGVYTSSASASASLAAAAAAAAAAAPGAAAASPHHPHAPYRRTAIFPHGHAKKEVGVVSDRAIKHVHHLEALLAAGRAVVGGRERCVSAAAVLFVVARDDCAAFRPCHEACPVFARVLRRAAARGVHVLAYDVSLDLPPAGLGEATMALRHRLPVVFDAVGGGAEEDDAELDATVARVLAFNASDPRTHYKRQGGGKAAAAGAGAGAAAGAGKAKKQQPKKKKVVDSDDSDDDDDDDAPPKKKTTTTTTTKKATAATTTTGAPRRSSRR